MILCLELRICPKENGNCCCQPCWVWPRLGLEVQWVQVTFSSLILNPKAWTMWHLMEIRSSWPLEGQTGMHQAWALLLSSWGSHNGDREQKHQIPGNIGQMITLRGNWPGLANKNVGWPSQLGLQMTISALHAMCPCNNLECTYTIKSIYCSFQFKSSWVGTLHAACNSTGWKPDIRESWGSKEETRKSWRASGGVLEYTWVCSITKQMRDSLGDLVPESQARA